MVCSCEGRKGVSEAPQTTPRRATRTTILRAKPSARGNGLTTMRVTVGARRLARLHPTAVSCASLTVRTGQRKPGNCYAGGW